MDTVSRYRQTIEQVLLEHTKIPDALGNVEYQIVFDRTHDHYLLVQVGWTEQERIYGVLAHVDLRGDKVWIQADGTEQGVADQLRQAGIPPQNIVLGYRMPEIRKHTGYAVA